MTANGVRSCGNLRKKQTPGPDVCDCDMLTKNLMVGRSIFETKAFTGEDATEQPRPRERQLDGAANVPNARAAASVCSRASSEDVTHSLHPPTTVEQRVRFSA